MGSLPAAPHDPTWLGLPADGWPDEDHANPFVRYRTLLDSHRAALARGWSDARFVELVEQLDSAVEHVDGTGFRVTPVGDDRAVAAALGHDAALWLKDETGNVAGSHKARHLFGLALALEVDETPIERPLAIASCGNAALAASVVARAAGRPLRVFVPTWADPGIVAVLQENGATIEVCARESGELGDPCYRTFEHAVSEGAVPFGCQGPVEPRTLDGGRTLGWELTEAVDGCDRVVVHVGGGALGSSLVQALATAVGLNRWDSLPRIDTLQTEGCAPLAAAMDRLPLDHDWSGAPDGVMQPWPTEPTSVADGILDDVTYDWYVLAWAMRVTDGTAIVAPEAEVEAAHAAASAAGWNVSATGSAALAALLIDPSPAADTALVMSGRSRS